MYRCKLLGEKINPQNQIQIIFKLKGMKNIHICNLQDVLNSKTLLSEFSPKDAYKLGLMAFNEIILKQSHSDQQRIFHQIRHNMLNSTHDTIQSIDPNMGKHKLGSESQLEKKFLFAPSKNSYVFHLVGFKIPTKEESSTTIIYTIFGKREGYTKRLTNIITDQTLLSCFHPTEAIKFGFIHTGEEFFNSHNNESNNNS